jgi:hypothetical protein
MASPSWGDPSPATATTSPCRGDASPSKDPALPFMYPCLPMRAFFALLEADRFVLPGSELSHLPRALLSTLRAEGIVRDEDPGMVEISPTDLGRSLRRLYGVRSGGLALPSALDERPVLLGWTGEGATRREVILVLFPARGLRWALRRPHRALVLVPTASALTEDLRDAHGPGAFVELEALEESLLARGGRLVRKRGRALASKEPVAPIGKESKAFLGGAKRWNEVRICLVNASVVRVDLPGRSLRCTPADLGMVMVKSRKPTATWAVLVTLCESDGYFKTTRYGTVDATTKAISRLRVKLHELFDIQTSPFHRYLTGTGWKARFVAQGRVPRDFVQAGRRSAMRKAPGDKPDAVVDDEGDFSKDDPNSWNA